MFTEPELTVVLAKPLLQFFEQLLQERIGENNGETNQ